MVDVGGDDSAASGHFLAHKFRRDVLRQICAPTLAGMLVAQHFATNALTAHIFANGDKLHLWGNHASASIVQLRNAFTRQGFTGQRQVFKAQMV
ncbi:hypothetical protein D3C73_885950 [compost metagenome]